MFLLVLVLTGSPGQRAIKQLCVCVCVIFQKFISISLSKF